MTEVIEGEAIEVIEPRAIAVRQQPGQALVTDTDRPHGAAEMVAAATELANALRDIVEAKRLYAVISGKKFPQVEAWMTIARMDNVVAREAQAPIRHDDGSYEGFAELVRLSDGMVIGRGSALCGTPDDMPWAKRGEPQRRSMAVTRAMSRAFRQQYSWVMALAGYEPTPAEEMADTSNVPAGSPGGTSSPAGATQTDEPVLVPLGAETHTGRVTKGDSPNNDLEYHHAPDGLQIGFKLALPDGKALPQVICGGPIAAHLRERNLGLLGETVTVTGDAFRVEQAGRRSYRRLMVTLIDGDVINRPVAQPVSAGGDKVDDLDKLPF